MMRINLKKILFVIGIALFMGVFLQFSISTKYYTEAESNIKKDTPPYFKKKYKVWSDSVYQTLSRKERIGQMMMVPAYPNKGDADKKRVANLIKNHHVGGVIFFQGTPEDVYKLAKYYQSISKVPLLIAIDGEWGLSMRLKNTIKYPKQMTLGAVSSDIQIYEMGRDMAKQFKHLGIHVNFAPVVDINNNPLNPVINARSFGESRTNVAKKGLLYMKGLQDEGVLAFAKHFPGHGDTETDSHYGLPLINHSVERLDSLELYPFKALINGGVGGVMMAHMNIPSLDSTPNLPSTLSPKIAEELLQQKMSFKGLVVTDAMNMAGVSKFFTPVEANVKAVQAGNDILLMPHEVNLSVLKILDEIERDSTLLQKVDESCKKILQAKSWAIELASNEVYSSDSLHKPAFVANRNKLLESAVTVVKNDNELIPFMHLDTLKIATVSFGNSPYAGYRKALNLYAKVDNFSANDYQGAEKQKELFVALEKYNLVLVAMHSNSMSASKKFGFTPYDVELADTLMAKFSTVLVGLSNAYTLTWFDNLDKNKAIVTVYENSKEAQKSIVQVLFGASPATGLLPISLSNKYREGHGLNTRAIDRFKYVEPFEAGIDKKKLLIIDSIVADAIEQKAMPGCQVFAAKDGRVFFNKAYGYHTYSKNRAVKETDLYDLASITKVAASVPSLMSLVDEGEIDLEARLADYLTTFDTCSKGDAILSDILLHQAGLAAWIPFYWATIEPVYPSQDIYSTKYSDAYPIKLGNRVYANKHLKYKTNYFDVEKSEVFANKVADGMYMNKMFEDSIWYKIAASEHRERGHYKYSDLGFYLFYKIIEDVTQVPLEHYADSVFYKRLGAHTLGYLPLERHGKDEIVPTENDLVFRKQIVHGYVHDPGAAMLGGVSGHAGLFGNANDLAKLMQMYLNGGKYGDQEYVSRKVIKEFTGCPSCKEGNRRGLGFDKPQADTNLSGPGFKGISSKSFGHTGFTGTMAWADPTTGILYIFLSNRVYPDASNFKLVRMDVRTNIQEAFYEARM